MAKRTEKKPIIKVYFMKPKEAWFKLSEKERNDLMSKDNKNLKEVGGKTILTCTSYWSNEDWSGFGVEEFPNIEAVQKHAELIAETHLRYFESKTYLGHSLDS